VYYYGQREIEGLRKAEASRKEEGTTREFKLATP
jgi:hypothetical protein